MIMTTRPVPHLTEGELVQHLDGELSAADCERVLAHAAICGECAERLRALQDVLAEHQLPLPDDYIVHGDYSRGSGYDAMRQLLDLAQRPRAVFAANDQMAADALCAVRERGLSTPRDVAIAGFDDISLASYTAPPLSTVRQPTYMMGRLALEAVLAASSHHDEPPRVVLPTELVTRESCGCVVQPALVCSELAGRKGPVDRAA